MNSAFVKKYGNDLKLLFALSRTPHGLIDMAAPAAAALLCLGGFPSIGVSLVGLITLFAGYTAVYALNDVVDLRIDKKKVRIGGYEEDENYLDGALTRHPMAKGALSLSSGLIWTIGWALIALAGAFWLNPVCLYIFLAGCILEGIYCLLWRVTPLRAVINGIVKTLGAVAAVFAVNPNPPLLFLLVLFLWIFFWEIGGQNIPCDWTDIEEDRHFRAQTIPVRLGPQRAAILAGVTLVCTTLLNLPLFWISAINFGGLYMITALAANIYFLLLPAHRLNLAQSRSAAMDLFNKASYYPLAILVIVLLSLMTG